MTLIHLGRSMTDIKTKNIMELEIDIDRFLLLMFGFIRKLDFKNAKDFKNYTPLNDDNSFLNVIKKEYDDPFTKLKVKEMLELHSEFTKAIDEGTLAESIIKPNANNMDTYTVRELEHSTVVGVEENWKEEDCYTINHVTQCFIFSSILEYLKSEYDLESDYYADWFYPLIGKEQPFRYKSPTQDTQENLINFEELPDTLKVLIECWQNPKAKFKNGNFDSKDQYLQWLLDEYITPYSNRYKIETNPKNKQTNSFTKSHMKTIDLLINYER